MILNLIAQARELLFDNKNSGLSATDVQGAIDEVKGGLDTVNSNLKWKELALNVACNTPVNVSSINATEFFVKCGTMSAVIPYGVTGDYRDTYYAATSNYQYMNANYNGNAINLNAYMVNGASAIDTMKYSVYYK